MDHAIPVSIELRASRVVLIVALGVIAAALPAVAGDSEEDRPTAEGSIAWVFDSDLDMIGTLDVDLPFRVGRRTHLYVALDTATAIQKTLGDFTFDVRELDYRARIGVRRGLLSGQRLTFTAGHRSRDLVDADGRFYVRVLGVGLESSPSPAERLRWRVSGGPVVDDGGVSADAWLHGALRLDRAAVRTGRFRGFGIDVEVDALAGGGDVDADLRLGPRASWDLSPDHRLDVFLHYLRARHPLGVNLTGLLVGIAVGERPGELAPHGAPPDIGGSVSYGGGQGREAARLRLDVAFPRLPFGGWLVADFDANALSGRDTTELYYFYRLGYERPLASVSGGLYFYHRSNHQLAEPNDRITSINVAEAGLRTRRWDAPGAPEGTGRRWGDLDASARLGVLLTSTFGENRRWHAGAGFRWWLPFRWRSAAPLLQAEIEEGDVGWRKYGLGVVSRRGYGLRLEYRNDEQYFGLDRTALLLVGERRF